MLVGKLRVGEGKSDIFFKMLLWRVGVSGFSAKVE